MRRTRKSGEPAGRAVKPACLVLSPERLQDPALLAARWTVRSDEPYRLLEELLGDTSRDLRRMAFAGGRVAVTTTRQADGGLSFSVASPSASLCKARLRLDDRGFTAIELRYRRGYGCRLLTTPEGTVLLEVLMGYLLGNPDDLSSRSSS